MAKFWSSTNNMSVFEKNLEVKINKINLTNHIYSFFKKIFERNMFVMFEDEKNGTDKVKGFMSYFKKQYINKKGIYPYRWLHFSHKKEFFYDPTNNVSETLNRNLKRRALLPFDAKTSLRKLVCSIDDNFVMYENIDRHTHYGNTLASFIYRKEKRLKKQKEKFEILLELYSLESYLEN